MKLLVIVQLRERSYEWSVVAYEEVKMKLEVSFLSWKFHQVSLKCDETKVTLVVTENLTGQGIIFLQVKGIE